MQSQKLEIGRLAYQAKVHSIKQYNLSSSSEKALGLPTDCIVSNAAEDVIFNNINSSSRSSSAAVYCHECSSDDDSERSSSGSDEQRGGANNSRQRTREKELKDYAYSKALVDFKVACCVFVVNIIIIYKTYYNHLSHH